MDGAPVLGRSSAWELVGGLRSRRHVFSFPPASRHFASIDGKVVKHKHQAQTSSSKSRSHDSMIGFVRDQVRKIC